jgi:RHS repeat-associated protein
VFHLLGPLPSRILFLVVAILTFLTGPETSFAQQVGYTNNTADAGLRSEMRVDPSTLALGFQLSLGNYPGRAGSSLPINISYSSKVWRIAFEDIGRFGGTIDRSRAIPRYAEHSAAGWTTNFDLPYLEGLEWQPYDYTGAGICLSASCPLPEPGTPIFYVYRMLAHMPDGSTHELRRDDTPTQNHTTGNVYYAVDGSRIRYEESNQTLFLPDGSRYVFAANSAQYIDRNGNTLNYNQSTKQWTDTLGRTVGRPPLATGTTGYVTYTIPGVAGSTMTYRLRWRNLSEVLTTAAELRYKGDRTWTSQMQTLSPSLFSSRPVPDEFVMTEVTARFNPVVLNEVELPNGRRYTFTYNVWGEIDKVVYPTGSYERYVYGAIDGLSASLKRGAYAQGNRGVVDRWISVKGDGSDEAQNHWQYAATNNNFTTPYTVTITAPDETYSKRLLHGGPNSDSRFGFEDARNGMAYDESSYSATDQMLRRSLTEWVVSGPLAGGEGTATRDPRVNKQIEILLDTGGNALTKTTTFGYDADLNRTSASEYDYVSVTQTTGQTGTIGAISAGSPLRTSETTYLVNDTNIDGTTRAAYRARNLLGLVSSTRVKIGTGMGTIVAQSSVSYDEGTYPLLTYGAITGWTDPATNVRGNATSSASWLNTTGTWLQTHAQYDQAGNARNAWDAKGNQSQVEYSSTYSYAYPTLSRTAVPDPSGQYGSTTAFTSTSVFDFNTGHVTSTTDANNQIMTLEYAATDGFGNANPLQRLTRVNNPDGGWTSYGYGQSMNAGLLHDYVRKLTVLSASAAVETWQFFDGLGRPVRTFLNEGGSPAVLITSDTQYDSLGRAAKVSNPYRTNGSGAAINPSGQWTTTVFDALSRIKTVTTPDNAVVSTSYSGVTVTVTDQTGKQRKSVTDGLGRLKEVYEDPAGLNYLTSYTYDVLGNLRKVDQGGQQRFFMYDSLSRLIRAKNPEQAAGSVVSNMTDSVTGNTQWSMAYGYDNNGNLTARVDARDVTTTYAYDALNRNTTVRYTDGTKDIDRHYDNPTANKNGLGRFWYFNWDAANNTRFDSHLVIDQYDAMGRPANYRQHFLTNGVVSPQFNVTRTYDKAGHVLTQTYPSGRTVSYGYDNAGRLSSNTGNLGDGVTRTYASAISYSEFGGLQQEQFGTQTPLYHKLHYNVRGQLYDVRLSTLSLQANEFDWNRVCLAFYYGGYAWGQSGPLNNGNLTMQQHWAPADEAFSNYGYTEDHYNYEALNRLASTNETHGGPWGVSAQDYQQVYNYDRWGNRTINQSQTTTNVPHPNYTADTSSNRLVAPAGYNYGYDNVGNQTNDNYTGQGARTYDAENRMKQAWANNQWQNYTYDADGRRIKRNVNGAETWQIYGMDGELLAEYAAGAAPFLPSTEYGYRNGELLVTITNGDPQRLNRFVTNLYYGALQRDPTAQELTDKVNQLAAAGAQSQSQLLTTANQIARSLFTATNYETSPYRSDAQYVADLYYAYLQRAPDDGGLGYWTWVVSVNGRANVCNAFEASGEFQTLVANLYGTAASDNERTEHFIHNFYLGAYGRSATSTELQQQRDALNAAAAQNQVAVQAQAETFGRSLFVGQVNDGSLSNTQYVTNLYEGFLQRGPDAGGLGYWSGSASVGQGRQNVLNAFAACGAFRELSGTLYREANWLVADHLGTPRVIVNKSGSLASVKRHDYLPFGEELFAGIGGRTTTQGYAGDSVRQKFTLKERDIETGLDYFLARYYSSTQGRFTSIDPILITEDRLIDPQTLNLYGYARNSPLVFIDPTGEDITIEGGTEDQQRAVRHAIENLRQQSVTANKAFSAYDKAVKDGGADLAIHIENDEAFDKNIEVAGKKSILAVTGSMGGDEIDKSVKVGAQMQIRSSAVNVENERAANGEKSESLVEGVLSHEVVGHGQDIYRDPDGFSQRSKEDKSDKTIPYEKRRSEVFADRATKIVGIERATHGHIQFKTLRRDVRFGRKLLP